MEHSNIRTFVELYEFLQIYNENSIIDWLINPWAGKDKQESLLRLFSKLGIISKLQNYNVCNGNFNLNTIKIIDNIYDIFYNNEHKQIKLKDNGDSSDLTCISKDKLELLAISSKNLSKYHIGILDIEKIKSNLTQYSKKYKTKIGICVKCHFEINNILNNAHITSTKNIQKELNELMIIDWNDLNKAYLLFKRLYNSIPINKLTQNDDPILNFKPHQQLSIIKTIKYKKNCKNILWGHVPRSGKSYIMAGVIIEDSKNKKNCNYLIITTAPNETIAQYFSVLRCKELNDFNILRLSSKCKLTDEVLSKKNIIICSKQFLDGKTELKTLKKLNIDIRFLDEVHNGGTTELSKKSLNNYGNDSFTIFITATYNKPSTEFKIDNSILWDLEDIQLCKNYNKLNKERLIIKHGNEFENTFNDYSDDYIKKEYLNYPNLNILSDDIDIVYKEYIQNKTIDNNYGWSVDACFNLNEEKNRFENEQECIDIWRRIFGHEDNLINSDCYINRINNQIKQYSDQRLIDNELNPSIIMCFMPCNNNLDEKCNLTKNLLEEHFKFINYEICIINSKVTDNAKQLIEQSRQIAINTKKNAVLVLSGKQCSLGVTIHNCDVVILLNNSKSFDLIYQMMFRCMTESNNLNYKKYDGFVIDLNIHRVIQQIFIEYSSLIRPELNIKDSIKYLLKSNIIKFNKDKWIHTNDNFVNKYTNKIYQIYTKNAESAVNHYLKKISNKVIILSNTDSKFINKLFKLSKSTTKSKTNIVEDKTKDNIKTGLYKENLDDSLSDIETDKKQEKVNLMDMVKHIIPLICLLTIHSTESNNFIKMLNLIKDNTELYYILHNQFIIWWDKDMSSDEFNHLISIFSKNLSLDESFNHTVEVIKDIFIQAKDDKNELSKLIDKYLIPQELEKKKNAEVSTPYKLRQEMLDIMPVEFWTKKQKVFEPCSGKGGFLIDIVHRFQTHSNLTYKEIVEECIYFSDINDTNIYINKLLLDPNNEYKLNYNLGDTLKLNIKEKWNLEGFDAVIGNPPYSTNPSNPNTTPIYNLFIEYLINNCQYLIFVIPSRWFSGGKGLDKFRKFMINRTDIKLIKHEENAKLWFGNYIEIKGGVNYFLKNNKYKGNCEFNSVEYNLNKYDCIYNTKYHKFIDKFSNYENITKLYKGRFFKIETNDKKLLDGGNIICYVSHLKSKNRIKYINEYNFNENNTFWKVITTRAAFKAHSGFGEKFILKPNEIHTGSYISFKVNSEYEADSLKSYLNCKLANYMLSIKKISQDINEKTCEFIPLVPLNKIWSDKLIYEHFNLSIDEINEIETLII